MKRLEKDTAKPQEQQPQNVSQHDCKLGRVQRRACVRSNLFTVFLEVLPNLCVDDPGDQMGDTDKPYL